MSLNNNGYQEPFFPREEGGENVPLVNYPGGYVPVDKPIEGSQEPYYNNQSNSNAYDEPYSYRDKPYDPNVFQDVGTEDVQPQPMDESNKKPCCACSFDCRRLPKVILSFISAVIFLAAFLFPTLHVPLYIEGSPFASKWQDFDPYYDAAMAPSPDAIAHVYLLNVQACIHNMTNLAHRDKNESDCTPFRSTFLSMDNETFSFQIQSLHFLPGTNVEYLVDPTVGITGKIALFALMPLFILATVFYSFSLFGSRRHCATMGAFAGFAVGCIGGPMALYGFSISYLSTINLSSQVGTDQSILPGILIVTAVGIQVILIWITGVCCCCCHRYSKEDEERDAVVEINDSVIRTPAAKSAGLHKWEVIFSIIIWSLGLYLWACFCLLPYCAYIPQCAVEDMNGCLDTGEHCISTACAATVCSNMKDYGLLKGILPFYAAFVIVSFFTPAAKALRNARNCVGTKQYVDRLKRQPPQLWFHVQNYYIEETRINGYTTDRRRINTNAVSGSFEYAKWFDRTPALILPRSMADHLRGAPTRIHTKKSFSFANNETRREFQRQFNDFIYRNRNPNQSCEPSNGIEVDGFEEFALTYMQEDDANIPNFFRYRWHFFASLLTLTPLYEFIFYAESTSAELELWKFVSI